MKRIFSAMVGVVLLAAAVCPRALGQAANPLVGVWTLDEGFQVTELLFRSDGRYLIRTESTDPGMDLSSADFGEYEVSGNSVAMASFEFFGERSGKLYEFRLGGGMLGLTRIDFPLEEVLYQYRPGSREEVLQREDVAREVVGTWQRAITFFGTAEYTFRPGGYYFLRNIPEDPQFPVEIIRGRYEREGSRLILRPYSGVAAPHEADFFGNTLTLVRDDGLSGEFRMFELVPGSPVEVRAKSAEAEVFLAETNWMVGVWEVRDGFQSVDLTVRPDGRYAAETHTELLRGMVRGRYALEARRIHLEPFVGQGIYSRSNGEFGKVPRTREIDFYDGELQLIDLEAISQSVTIATKRAGSDQEVLTKTLQARTERERDGWQVGIWEVNDPSGWMEFTFRPDRRYIAKAGSSAGSPSQVERGQHRFAAEKLTLAPYAGLGVARGFELDFYDGNLFLVGDLQRMVVARKVAGSEAGVIEKTQNPSSVKGERGSILGRWTANLPGYSAELVFRNDGQFRLQRCADGAVSWDYGLFSADMGSRSVVYDSRFVPVQTLGMDFYGNTMTLHGGHGAPSTYVVNLGTVDASIQASLEADGAEAVVDAGWIARIPVAPRDPGAVHTPGGSIPDDPNPTRIFPAPTVFGGYQLYRRLLLGVVTFNVQGSIKTVNVVNTREWHFFPTGRVLVRFRNHGAGAIYPNTIETVSDSWGAYRITPKPLESDILHIYADNAVVIEMDSGEQAEMTLEDGRRHLFWGKDYQIQSVWASEQRPVPCEPPANSDASLINARLSLETSIGADPIGAMKPIAIKAGGAPGQLVVTGNAETGTRVVLEAAASAGAQMNWRPLETNSAAGGAFTFTVTRGSGGVEFYRVRAE